VGVLCGVCVLVCGCVCVCICVSCDGGFALGFNCCKHEEEEEKQGKPGTKESTEEQRRRRRRRKRRWRSFAHWSDTDEGLDYHDPGPARGVLDQNSFKTKVE